MFLISVVIITYNEERNIDRCLQSVQNIADEIIVLDSFSTDNTIRLAGNKGAKVFQQAFSGYMKQKNDAISLASHNIILSLDADEALDETLSISIRAAKTSGTADAWTMNRCTNYCGTFIRHGSWYPDRKIRMFNKNKAEWAGADLHEGIKLQEANLTVQHLKGDLLHYSFSTIEEHEMKCDKYSSILANSLFANGKKSNHLKIFVRPVWTFIQGYIIRLGFLDGFHGFVIAVNSAHATFLKYAKLYQLQLEHRRKFL